MDMIKVLCLHGCCQDKDIFKGLMRPFIKKGKTFDFQFIEGPFDHPEGGKTWTNPPLLKTEQIWIDSMGNREDVRSAHSNIDHNESILTWTFSLMDEYIKKNYITVLLGFSQGAFVCYEYVRKFRHSPITKIVAMSGFTFNREITPPLDVDIINVIHPMDSIVPNSLAYSNGDRTTTISHNDKNVTVPSRDGHKCPHKAAQIRMILSRIADK